MYSSESINPLPLALVYFICSISRTRGKNCPPIFSPWNVKQSSGKHVYVTFTPLHPTFIYGVCRGIPIFLIPKHRLWVLVRTASPRGFSRVPTIYVLSKNKKKFQKFEFATENFQFFNFYNLRKIYILHGRVFLMIKVKVII